VADGVAGGRRRARGAGALRQPRQVIQRTGTGPRCR